MPCSLFRILLGGIPPICLIFPSYWPVKTEL